MNEQTVAADVVDDIREFFVETAGLPQAPGVDEDVFAAGYVDSLFALRLVTFVESRFGFEVTADDLDLDNFRTIGRIAGFVGAKRRAG